MKSKIFSPEIPEQKSRIIRRLVMNYLAGGKPSRTQKSDCVDVKTAKICLRELLEGKSTISTGNSGLLTRMMISVCASMNKKIILKMDDQMGKRPVEALMQNLKKMGAKIERKGTKILFLPSQMHSTDLKVYHAASSQFLTSLLLIAPLLKGKTTIARIGKRSIPYSEMTIRMLEEHGIRIVKTNREIVIEGPQQYREFHDTKKEADMASASTFIALAILHRTKILIKNLQRSTSQPERDFLDVIEKGGCKLTQQGKNLLIDAGNFEKIKKIDASNMPDSALALAVLAWMEGSNPILIGTETWRNKETNREKIINSLRRMKTPQEGRLETYGDHRIAMILSIIKSKFPAIKIHNSNSVQKSYIKFWGEYRRFILSLNKNFILIGPPGAGKTTLGKMLAKKMGYRFKDTDDLIEKKFGTPLSKCIEESGWRAFRKIEEQIVAKLPRERSVIATGGGTVLERENQERLRKNAYTIALLPPYKVIKERLQKTHPQYRNIKSLYYKRRKTYESCCDMMIDDPAVFEEKFFHTQS